MKYISKLSISIIVLFITIQITYSQCNQALPDINKCNMENVDFDTDGDPDGIINLYTETGTTVADGVWNIAPEYSVAFDPATGNLSMWALQNSTTVSTQNEYAFELKNTTCGGTPFRTVRLVLGPYSGVALPRSGTLNVNAQGCDSETFDLFTAFVQDDKIPPPHRNGTWTYNGTSPNFIGFNDKGSGFNAIIPYQPGLPRVDQETFEFTYRVPGITPCSPFEETTVRIAIVRQVDSGASNPINICEDDLLAGVYDADINLRDDLYLFNEDIEGVWLPDLDPTNQISDAQDSNVNLRQLYDALVDGGNNLRFGCESYEYKYTVEQRSGVCINDTTTVSFTFYEQLRPFIQPNAPPKICSNLLSGDFELFDLLEFTTEGAFDFQYTDDYYVNWSVISSPDGGDLGVSKQPLAVENPRPADYRYRGKINTYLATPGIYIFEYAVSPVINCQSQPEICNPFASPSEVNYCEHPCDIMSAQVTIEILPFEYAGEDTKDINLCESLGQVDLRSLLTTNGNTIATTGVWTNSIGDVIDNTFVFPILNSNQTFTFTYKTTSTAGCVETANLTFTIYKEPNAGEDATTTLCSDNLIITLFDLLGGNPDTTGTWEGPFGYTSSDHLGTFDINNDILPVLGAGNYLYTVPGNDGCSTADTSTVFITIVEPLTIGNDRSETFCKIDGSVNLYSLLDRDTPRTGIFEDTDNTNALTADGIVEFETLTNNIYTFRYVITNTQPCDQSSLNVSIQIVDLPTPVVPAQEFCILDAKRLEDIEVDVLNYNWYTTLESDTPVIDNPLLYDNQVFYIATVDTDNCESERLEVLINILNTGERFANGDLCTLDFQDGVSPNGDNQNDTFHLLIDEVYNIPEAFPDFDLKIYNRYGSIVYEGNINTEEFRGESNISVRLGDDLPSGTYFYIFTPNFENNLPIQGSFYLSR
ncbi:gliding motility-associated C-terminal domain-containing protein [Aquimarina muelleri]|uniref:gliding motility-associated C-terminal domain-containing protein n=1 Tax=Aquimarina muelleri TaxID=279356 RepID=UPI003F6843DC